jgi:hypothetical protein
LFLLAAATLGPYDSFTFTPQLHSKSIVSTGDYRALIQGC